MVNFDLGCPVEDAKLKVPPLDCGSSDAGSVEDRVAVRGIWRLHCSTSLQQFFSSFPLTKKVQAASHPLTLDLFHYQFEQEA